MAMPPCYWPMALWMLFYSWPSAAAACPPQQSGRRCSQPPSYIDGPFYTFAPKNMTCLGVHLARPRKNGNSLLYFVAGTSKPAPP